MKTQPYLAAVLASVLLCAAVVGSAVAGEVTGPPGSENSKSTAAPQNANSNCAYSGLNDFDEEEGQNDSFVQVAADAWKYYGLPHGFPGTSGACHGGTNPQRFK